MREFSSAPIGRRVQAGRRVVGASHRRACGREVAARALPAARRAARHGCPRAKAQPVPALLLPSRVQEAQLRAGLVEWAAGDADGHAPRPAGAALVGPRRVDGGALPERPLAARAVGGERDCGLGLVQGGVVEPLGALIADAPAGDVGRLHAKPLGADEAPGALVGHLEVALVIAAHAHVAITARVALALLVQAGRVVCDLREGAPALHEVCHPAPRGRVRRNPLLGPDLEGAHALVFEKSRVALAAVVVVPAAAVHEAHKVLERTSGVLEAPRRRHPGAARVPARPRGRRRRRWGKSERGLLAPALHKNVGGADHEEGEREHRAQVQAPSPPRRPLRVPFAGPGAQLQGRGHARV
mmetsp:Transcript_6540/g.22388  ORF Transcript_6540/g.22388 Transcript_6540/m.22388 type:complete len:356 (+) Transcript_6540:217-1284(+)